MYLQVGSDAASLVDSQVVLGRPFNCLVSSEREDHESLTAPPENLTTGLAGCMQPMHLPAQIALEQLTELVRGLHI